MSGSGQGGGQTLGDPLDLALGHLRKERQRQRARGDVRGWFVFVVQVPRGYDRDEVIRGLRALGVQSKPYLPAIHLMSFYRERFGHREGEFPVCEDVARRSLALPFHPQLGESDVERVTKSLIGIIESSARGPRSTGSSAATPS